SWLILLPGPPRELRPMFLDQVIPLLRAHFPLDRPRASRTLRTTGLGESLVEEKIAGPLAPLITSGLQIGYCARVGQFDLRLAATGAASDRIVGESER